MTDLIKLLDLDTKPVQKPGDDSFTVPVPASPTALELDEWALRKGRELLAESGRLRDLPLDDHAIADFHGAAFLPDPELTETCVDSRRREFLSTLFETPEYRALHSATRLNAPAAELAAMSFAIQFARLKEEDASASGGTDREISALRAVGRALGEAREAVDEMHEAAAAFGLGRGASGSSDAAAIARLYRRIRDDPRLRRICELAGRYRRTAQSKQRRKVRHGLDDVVGVSIGGDIGRALPSELVRLALPEFEDDTLRRLAEGQLLCREFSGVERVGRGPILVSVDESGSMLGDKADCAKAIALALAWVARSQRRWAGLAAYSGETGERLLALPPGRWDETALADWLGAFIGGGSTLDIPVEELPGMHARLGAPKGITDVILITDALCRIPVPLRERFRKWKTESRSRVIALVIQSQPGDVTHIADEVHLVGSLDVSESAVERVLSI